MLQRAHKASHVLAWQVLHAHPPATNTLKVLRYDTQNAVVSLYSWQAYAEPSHFIVQWQSYNIPTVCSNLMELADKHQFLQSQRPIDLRDFSCKKPSLLVLCTGDNEILLTTVENFLPDTGGPSATVQNSGAEP